MSRTLTLEQTRALANDTVPATLGVRRGRCSIRTYGLLYRKYDMGDLHVELYRSDRRMFTAGVGLAPELETDGTNPQLQEQLLGTQDFQRALREATNVIRQAARLDKHIRVAIGSGHGRHRSVAFAEVLAAKVAEWTQVEVLHMEMCRWKREDAPRRIEEWPAPLKHQYCLVATC